MALTVTATASGAQSFTNICLSVRVLDNASYTQPGATAVSTTATTPQLAVTAHAAGSLVYGSVLTGASSAAFTGLDASTTSLFNAALSGDGTWNFGHFKSAATTTSPATYGWTGAAESSGTIYIACAEILASGGTLAENASTPAPVSTSSAGTVATASFTPPAAAVLVACVGTDWTGAGTVAVALSDSAGAYTWTQLAGTGTGDLTSVWAGIPTAVTAAGAAALSGLGALGAAGQLAAAGTAGLSGTGVLTAAASGSASLSGTGALGATGVRAARGTAGLSGTGVLTSTGTSSGASLSGTGALGVTGVRAAGGAAALSGTGALSGYEQLAALSGLGALSAAATVFAPPGASALTGSGALGVSGLVLGYTTGMTGSGSLTAFQSEQLAFLSGLGVFGVTGERLGYVLGMTGIGYLSVPQVTGGLVGGVGGAAVPQALPGSSQVAVAPQGSAAWQWLGTLGQVTALTYSFICPGGCDQMTCTVMVPAAYRTQLFDPGWQVKVVRGGHDVWHGKLDEPAPTASGWNLTAVGTGNLGTNFRAYYAPGDTWPAGVADDVMNRAIARGLPWVNPGMAASPYYSQFWFGQAVDPGAQTVTAFLNLICTRGALTWYVNSQPGGSYLGDDLQVFPLPAVPSRLLACTTPVARTLGGDVNTIFIRYEVTADNTTTSAPAAYSVVSVQNAQSVAAHGVIETYIDLSDAGVMSLAAAQAVGNAALQFYQRASFAGPFQASYGQLLNNGGQPVDPGTDQAGTVVRLLLTDFGYGGEVVPGPVTFITGAYSWDDFAQVATITPYQSFDQSLTGMLSTQNTVLTPVTAAST